ncbi:MAG: PDDEXK nuclease domain-containing protein [Candidatus Nanoarchaeia archaeon]|nr:PDDEXK nuclease domain-containing protein [Candidatus Nanoarchaeia archaeon]
MQKESNPTLVLGISNTYDSIRQVIEKARGTAYRAVNFIIVTAYWNIGKIIIEEEQKGKRKADYGAYLIKELSARLTKEYGQGFDERNLRYIRQFFVSYPIRNALRSELSWTHYRTLLRVENRHARNFYLLECINSRWSTRELERQINTLLYERLTISKSKKKVMELSAKGLAVQKPEDIIKDPYVLEFLNLPENYSEKELEGRIISNLQIFLLELGKGFSFVARQFRMEIGRKQFYADLVFYNKNLRCYVLIELKISGSPSDIGQMSLYLNYFKRHMNQPGDNAPIGIILSGDSTSIEVKYALGGINRRIFASRYMLDLPSVEELKKAAGIN